MTANKSLHTLARVLLIVGGLILILGAALQVVGGIKGLLDISPRVPSLDLLTSAVIGLIVGVLALIGAGQVTSPAWSIILLVLGFLVGSRGGILIFIGALIALVATFVKT